MAAEETAKLIAKDHGKEEDENIVDNSLQSESKKTGLLYIFAQFCRLFSSFPLSVYFIVGNEFCERFAFYGMRAVLVLYLVFQLNLTEDSATAVFHLYTFLAFFMPIFGSMIADSYIGKFWTILIFSFIYAVGCISISLSAIPCILGYIVEARLGLCFFGLILIAFGTGGIKPCVSAFGGDQVKKGDKTLLSTFFSLFYFSINAGSLISIFLTPILRRDIQCFDDDCYAASFGVPAVLMISSIIVFLAGSYLYVRVPPTGRNVYIQIFSIIFYAIYQRIRKRGSGLKKQHWLDWAVPKYDPALVLGVKATIKVFVMFLPLPIFWALFDQQGSRWLLQVTRMDTSLGVLTVHPDQVQIINPILILILIPIFDKIVYPLVRKCGIKVTTLRKMTCGIFLAGIAFILSALVQIQIESGADRSAPDGSAFLKIFNPTSAQANFSIFNNSNSLLNSTVQSHHFARTQLEAARYQLSFKIEESGSIASNVYDVNLTSTLTCSVLLSKYPTVRPYCVNMNEAVPVVTKYEASIQYVNSLTEQHVFYVQEKENINEIYCNKTVPALGMSNYCQIPTGDFLLKFQNYSTQFAVLNGDIYSLLAYSGDVNETVQLYLDVERSVSFLWQVPMYVVMTVGEVMFSISGLEFAYSQSPLSLKSVMLGLWLLTVAFGNLLVFIISQFELFQSQVVEFFFFAGAAILISFLFALMSCFYKYMEYDEGEPQFTSSTTIRKTFTESQRLAEKID